MKVSLLVLIGAPLLILALIPAAQSMPMPDDHGMSMPDMETPDSGPRTTPEMPAGGQGMAGMAGMIGPYPMSRDGSGTSWQPDSTPQQGIHFMAGDWALMADGFVTGVFDDQGGKRGADKTFSSSMAMLMAERPLGERGTLGLRSMVSLDPLMGANGYPLLFATGETADGRTPLVDRQHPHDLFMELAGTYSYRLSEGSSVFAYAGLPGEPALGPSAFMHRFWAWTIRRRRLRITGSTAPTLPSAC